MGRGPAHASVQLLRQQIQPMPLLQEFILVQAWRAQAKSKPATRDKAMMEKANDPSARVVLQSTLNSRSRLVVLQSMPQERASVPVDASSTCRICS